ncbi:hypothetical protein GUH23_20000, partial [Xanthomonas citri pv. citri]|nr:hypothetical protein [Xanthomonas citri pv. citri]
SYFGGVSFGLTFPLGLDEVFFELDRWRDFVTDDGAEVFLAEAAEAAKAVSSLLTGNDVGVSPSDDCIGRFVESKDA